jgi:hypothetical protein
MIRVYKWMIRDIPDIKNTIETGLNQRVKGRVVGIPYPPFVQDEKVCHGIIVEVGT